MRRPLREETYATEDSDGRTSASLSFACLTAYAVLFKGTPATTTRTCSQDGMRTASRGPSAYKTCTIGDTPTRPHGPQAVATKTTFLHTASVVPAPEVISVSDISITETSYVETGQG